MWLRKKGIDVNFAKRQKWWKEVSAIVETDDQTLTNLVQNVYVNVCDAKLGELDFISNLLLENNNPSEILQEIAKRQGLIEHFAKIENLKEVPLETE